MSSRIPRSIKSKMRKLCSSEDSFALLHFKNTISINTFASSHCNNYVVSYPKTHSWKQGSDCCSWDGVTCDRFIGHVTALDLSSSQLLGIVEVNSSLFLLRNLNKLNLACNDFQGSRMSSKFGSMDTMTGVIVHCGGHWKDNQFIGLNSFACCIMNKHDINLKYNKAYRSKNHTLNTAFGDPWESFKRLPEFFYMLEQSNPGTVTKIETDSENRFAYGFMSLGVSIVGFNEVIRLVIAIDATHLKSKTMGCFISCGM
ncbi:hypothetical protein Ddye_005282 [Dipteronia dyeriana]|uniref:Leucine-rich repeat-containing N-terminal plant-type domain-containing protein n=1 Tax=Dipteronia dyeriana TaxID=168575 RepID=A0AAE0CPL5_9ROSI|nr:hypothetical protein Ddye_005282 [Dipteronia dyeriana]